MRSALLPALLLAPACTTVALSRETPGHACNPAGTVRFIGQPGTSETGAAIMRATGARVLRWAPPGYMLTMDYRADRVTVRLGPDRKITAINCG
jgi:hypothetical protein